MGFTANPSTAPFVIMEKEKAISRQYLPNPNLIIAINSAIIAIKSATFASFVIINLAFYNNYYKCRQSHREYKILQNKYKEGLLQICNQV